MRIYELAHEKRAIKLVDFEIFAFSNSGMMYKSSKETVCKNVLS